MKKLEKTVVSVTLKRTRSKSDPDCWELVLQAYPVVEGGKRKVKREYLNRFIRTPIWDKSIRNPSNRSTIYPEKRNANGIIMCESTVDQDSCIFADQMRQMRQREYDIAHIYEGHENEFEERKQRKKVDFIEYFKRLNLQRHNEEQYGSRNTWNNVAKLLKKFTNGKAIPMERINTKFINDFRSWIQTQDFLDGRKKKMGTNTYAKYFMLFRAGLRQAYLEGYLDINYNDKVKAIKKAPQRRDAFTRDEVASLYETPCKNETLKRAGLFSVLTGMRIGDIRQLQWKHIRNMCGIWRVDFRQNKTKQMDYLPISEEARELCGLEGNPEDLVFDGLGKCSSSYTTDLQQWFKDAGIERHMTFHCFRHTFATLQLESGTDIYTIKSMLGHTSVNTTQQYSHIVDPARRAAVNKLHIDNLTLEFDDDNEQEEL